MVLENLRSDFDSSKETRKSKVLNHISPLVENIPNKARKEAESEIALLRAT